MVLLFLLSCAPELEPDGSWAVSVTGFDVDGDTITTDCTLDTEGYREAFVYDLYYQGSFVEIRIGEEIFATGRRSGCYIEYQSSIYLEKSSAGDFNWQISGSADFQDAAGGCTTLPDQADWYGKEVLTVITSDSDDVEEGCHYEMQTVGSYEQSEASCCMICPEGTQACDGGCIDEEASCSAGSGCACNYY